MRKYTNTEGQGTRELEKGRTSINKRNSLHLWTQVPKAHEQKQHSSTPVVIAIGPLQLGIMVDGCTRFTYTLVSSIMEYHGDGVNSTHIRMFRFQSDEWSGKLRKATGVVRFNPAILYSVVQFLSFSTATREQMRREEGVHCSAFASWFADGLSRYSCQV